MLLPRNPMLELFSQTPLLLNLALKTMAKLLLRAQPPPLLRLPPERLLPETTLLSDSLRAPDALAVLDLAAGLTDLRQEAEEVDLAGLRADPRRRSSRRES